MVVYAILHLILLWVTSISAFPFCKFVNSKQLQAATTPRSRSRQFHGYVTKKDFDFSSTKAWENYYQAQALDSVTEWHASVSFETLGRFVPSDTSSVVMIGCGSSMLPGFIQNSRPSTNIILQDSSQTCLQMLRERYGNVMSYVCGDATKLSESLDSKKVAIIYDKGLMDAIFCNEGWERPIRLLLEESSKVLNDRGIYILVSYRLPQSTRDFLVDVGSENGLEWTFNMPGSNERVGISMARKLTPAS